MAFGPGLSPKSAGHPWPTAVAMLRPLTRASNGACTCVEFDGNNDLRMAYQTATNKQNSKDFCFRTKDQTDANSEKYLPSPWST